MRHNTLDSRYSVIDLATGEVYCRCRILADAARLASLWQLWVMIGEELWCG